MSYDELFFESAEDLYLSTLAMTEKQTLLIHDNIVTILMTMQDIDIHAKNSPPHLVTLTVALERLQTLYSSSVNLQINAHNLFMNKLRELEGG